MLDETYEIICLFLHCLDFCMTEMVYYDFGIGQKGQISSRAAL